MVRAVGADPAAVGDDVAVRQPGQRRTHRAPQRLEPGALLRRDHADQHVEAAPQLLRVLEDLVGVGPRRAATARLSSPRPGSNCPRARQGAGDQVPAGRVALGHSTGRPAQTRVSARTRW